MNNVELLFGAGTLTREEAQGKYNTVSTGGGAWEVCAEHCRSTATLLAAKKRRDNVGAGSLSGEGVKGEDATWSMSAGEEKEGRETDTQVYIPCLHGMMKIANVSEPH